MKEYEISINNTVEADSEAEAIQSFREWLVETGAMQGAVRLWHEDGTVTYVDADGTSWTG